MDNRNGSRNKRLAERPDRIALWAVAMAVVAMIAGVASARAGSSGGIGGGGTGAGATAAGATDCTENERAECDEFAAFDWARQRATWYGPGFFGNQTACGKTLARRTTGVAHRTLPCGSKVVIAYEGRYVRTKVIDRGPFANGAKWDLTQATARALEFEYTDHIRVAKLGT